LTQPNEEVLSQDKETGNAQVFDLHEAMARFEGNQGLLLESIEAFFEQSPILMSTIQDAIERSNSVQIHKAAHSLMDSVSKLAAISAFEASLRVEVAGRSGNMSEADAAFGQLEQEILTLTSALAAYRQDALSTLSGLPADATN